MTLKCLVILSTCSGQVLAEVLVNSLHQLAVVMPASVVSYEVQNNGQCGYAVVNDSELFDVLIGLLNDAEDESRQEGGQSPLSSKSHFDPDGISE